MKTLLSIIILTVCLSGYGQNKTLKISFDHNGQKYYIYAHPIAPYINPLPDTLVSPTSWNEVRRITNNHIRKLNELTILVQQLQQRIDSLEEKIPTWVDENDILLNRKWEYHTLPYEIYDGDTCYYQDWHKLRLRILLDSINN